MPEADETAGEPPESTALPQQCVTTDDVTSNTAPASLQPFSCHNPTKPPSSSLSSSPLSPPPPPTPLPLPPSPSSPSSSSSTPSSSSTLSPSSSSSSSPPPSSLPPSSSSLSSSSTSSYSSSSPSPPSSSSLLQLSSSTCYLFALFSLSTFITLLIFSANSDSESTTHKREPQEPKGAYSGSPVSGSDVWYLDRHGIRRRRAVWSGGNLREMRGLARNCGHSCTFRLRKDNGFRGAELQLYLNQWRQIPAPTNKSLPVPEVRRIRPIVQFVDSNDSTHARLSKVSPHCLYSAYVRELPEVSSIVNLCDSFGGIFGTLALPDGTYLIEPMDGLSSATRRSASRHKAHLVYKSRSHSFHDYDYLSNFTYNNDSASNSFLNGDFESNENSSNQFPTAFQPLIDYDRNNFTDQYYNWHYNESQKDRSRRSANSWDHYVEVLVVADNKMLLYHQNNLENYVLTLFSTVASIYRHPSLQAAINIIVTRLVILKNEAAGPRISENAQETLQQFCRWQEAYNDKNDDAPTHHDVAILLTRHDICRAPGKCDTLGLAELGTMCDSLRSCAIIEDNGLSAAFTITHELGHIFNIPHDDERKCGQFMALNKHNYHIMAPTLEYNTHPWSWSACSAVMLAKFLDANRAQTQCILDQPVERRYYDRMFEDPAPGAMFSANQQCQFVFGPSAELCPYMSGHSVLRNRR
ncbi:hypothetical protein AB6A40_000358 [Gnathostoma spinigerum]|uniref:Peptidase M12B domain-containing protein n=1 Tax=Gnathostoma spinigerum TaxID=75299 RepID=A0ABD6E1Y2_9BILA